jgi:hypothetical protein
MARKQMFFPDVDTGFHIRIRQNRKQQTNLPFPVFIHKVLCTISGVDEA